MSRTTPELHQMKQAVVVEGPDQVQREVIRRLDRACRQADQEGQGHSGSAGTLDPGEPAIHRQSEQQGRGLEQNEDPEVSATEPGCEVEAARQCEQGSQAARPARSPCQSVSAPATNSASATPSRR